jgi:hypothetical protein
MSVFSSELVVGFAPDQRLFVLEQPLIYWSGDKAGKGVEIIIPEGFLTDLASTPQVLWWLSPPWGWYVNAAVVHDYLYFCKGLYGGIQYTRRQCDGVLLSAMYSLARLRAKSDAELIVLHRVARVFYWAVRLFGGAHFVKT